LKVFACERKEGESIASFVADLQKASEFGDQLDDMHLGCLVIARNYEVLDLAMSMEQTTAGSKDVHRSSVSTTGLGSGKSTKCDLTLTPGLYRNIAPTDPRVRCRSPSNRVIVAVHYILR